MLLIDLPDVASLRLNIRRGESHFAAFLVMALGTKVGSLDEVAGKLLGPAELAYFSGLRFDKRRKSYLLGRYAAKLALSEAVSNPDLKSIQIVKGVFEQPIVEYEQKPGWAVTISHADSLAAGLAYPIGHPMGIDVERIDETRYETILSQLSPKEICWVEAMAGGKHKVAAALWTAKEALSKVLTTGLMTPPQIYNLAEFRAIGSGLWEGLFENFAQYKARVWSGSSYVLSIVLPKRSMVRETSDLGATL